jgi:hypothetical protein
MSISQKDIKVLWANAAGMCAFSDCRIKLCSDAAQSVQSHTIGEMAHIKGDRTGSNRHDPSQSSVERDSYSNLILLCPTHHTLIDRPENERRYAVADLAAIKTEHEAWVAKRLTLSEWQTKAELASAILPLVESNHQCFLAYGPHSEIARRNPESSAYDLWLTERLSTIVPNNRRLLDAIERNKQLFASSEQRILAQFELHVRSYERWVRDEIQYESVVRFPIEFADLIRRLANARA